MIIDFKTRFPGVDYRRFTAEQFVCYVRGGGQPVTLGDPAQPVGSIDALINAADLKGALGWQGRWIAVCECGGAEYVAEGQPFMCCSCWNRANGHQWLSVKFPKQRVAIEQILEKRPGRNRNWTGEKVADLTRENRQHGVEG